MSAQERGRERLERLRAEKGGTAAVPRASVEGLEIPVAAIEPNDWNPNVVDKPQMVKLRNGIKMILDQGLRPPPIVVRQLAKGRFQIIDGFHRWTTFRELRQETIPAYVLNVDDKTSRILTDTLNYLRGQPNEEKYSELIADLVVNQGSNVDELADLLPETRDELLDILAESQSGIKALLVLEERERELAKEADQILSDDAVWLDVTFRVSKAQAKVIEKEVSRIEQTLDGKHRRGRALEYMAVMSSQTDLDQSPTTGETGKRRKGS